MSKCKSYKTSSGRIVHYNSYGDKTGTSYIASTGLVRHYDISGKRISTSFKTPSGSYETYSNDPPNSGSGEITRTDRNNEQIPSSNNEMTFPKACCIILVASAISCILTCLLYFKQAVATFSSFAAPAETIEF